jgi:voltage-gated potassium channel
MKYSGRNHIILIGWNDKTKIVIQEILKYREHIDVVVIDNLQKDPLSEDRMFYINGDPANVEALLRANLPEAKGVIIFANQLTQENYSNSSLHIDGKTLLISKAITLFLEDKNKSIYVFAEIMKQDHIRLFKDVKLNKFIPIDEIISDEIIQSLFYN